jgi:RHS repeat-associated protein
LAERCDGQGISKFSYGKDTLLDKVTLSSGALVRYEYDEKYRIVPAKRFRSDCLTAEYLWLDALRLSRYLDHDHQLEYTFRYDESGLLDRVRITPMPQDNIREPGPDTDWLANMVRRDRIERLHTILGNNGNVLNLCCGMDQVGTLKILTTMGGSLVKEIQRDSFGLRLFDSFPDLFMPIGFAGGLEDPDTGLVHFGYRDYDPSIGRFTAPDPLGDTGGDHDLYDYCADDPVTMNDPSGLFPPAVIALAAVKALAVSLGLGGAYGAAKIADSVKSSRDEQESTAARDAVKAVAPKVAEAGIVSALPGLALTAPGALAAAGPRIGAMIQATGHADKIIMAGKFIEGVVNPNPAAVSVPSFLGSAASRLVEVYQDKFGKIRGHASGEIRE